MAYLKLKDVCQINMGQSPDSSSYNADGDGIPFFQGNADFGERYPLTQKWCNNPIKIAKVNDILISVRAPIGAVNYAKENCCIGRGLAAITPDTGKVSSEFIYWFLKGKNEELNSKGTGSTFKAIGRKVLEEVEIPDIDFDTQRRYAATLEKIYLLIQVRKKELEQFDDLIKARFVELFGDMETNFMNWDTYNFGECFEIASSKRILKSEWKTEGIPFLRVRDMVQLATTKQMNNEFFVSEQLYSTLRDSDGVPKEGDILVSATSTLGKCYIVGVGERYYFKDADILRFRCKNEMNPIYFVELMKTSYIKRQIAKTLGVTTVAHFTIKAAKAINMRTPPIELQNQFAAFVAEVDKSKVAVQKALDETQTLFDSLMQEYFG